MNNDALRCPACGSGDVAVRKSPATGTTTCLCLACGDRFSPPSAPEGRAAVPLRLFLSYGHPEESIALRIKGALEARGHEVWTDRSEIKAGDDWREQITFGIRASDGVIACLSHSSTCDPGACRDELAIASSMYGGKIMPILLEPAEEVSLPAELALVQWLDMHDWRERLNLDPSPFDSWFEGKMDELFTALEGDQAPLPAHDMEDIRIPLQPEIASFGARELLSRPIVGRKWLIEQVRDWLADQDSPRTLLLTGDAGVGKSAFCAHITYFEPQLRQNVGAIIFCNSSNHHATARAICTLAYAIACKIPAYRYALAGELEGRDTLDGMSDEDLFTLLLANPFSHIIDGGADPILLVVDGLDEAGDTESNPLAEALARFCDRLPTWVKVLVTSRHVNAATAPFGAAAEHVDLMGVSEENIADMREYLESALHGEFGSEANRREAVDEIVDRSGGCFLYARLVVDALSSGLASLEDALSCPPGLGAAMHRWLSRTFPDMAEYRASFRAPLGCILAAPGGALPESELRLLFDWSHITLGDFLSRCETILVRADDPLGGPSVKVVGEYAASWLASPEAGPFRSDPAAGAALIARTWHGIASSDPSSLSDYEATHLYDMLVQAGMEDEYESDWDSSGVFWRAQGLTRSLLDSGRPDIAIEHARRLERHGMAHVASYPAREATLLGSLGDALVDAGRPTEAEPLLREALSIRRSLAESDPIFLRDVALSLNALALVLTRIGRHAEAEFLYRESLGISRKLSETDPARLPDMAIALESLASVTVATGRHAEAEPLLREAIRIYRALAESDPAFLGDMARCLDNLANALDDMGRYAEAEPLLREAIGISKALAESDPACLNQLESPLINLSFTLAHMGRHAEAEPLCREAVRVSRELLESEPSRLRDVVISLQCLSMILEALGRTDEADQVAREAAAIREFLANGKGNRNK